MKNDVIITAINELNEWMDWLVGWMNKPKDQGGMETWRRYPTPRCALPLQAFLWVIGLD